MAFLILQELPSLQAYHHQKSCLDIFVDDLISFLNRSGVHLKQLTLGMHWPGVAYVNKLLNAVPCLHLHFRCTAIVCVVHELFEMFSESSSQPILVENSPGFLPSRLQSLTISGWGIGYACGIIPLLFSSPQRKHLRLEVIQPSEIQIDKDTLCTIF